MQNTRKIIIALSIFIMVLCSWSAMLDLPATERVDAGLNRALISFASARALNAVISVVQGTGVAIEPMGVGVNLTPGQLLDPINDLVEQFSNLMLIACVALGVQKILINVGSYWPVSMLLTVAVLSWVYYIFSLNKSPRWLSKLIVILLMIRFAIPLVTIGTDLVFQKFLEPEYTVNQEAISKAPELVAEVSPEVQTPPKNADEGWWEELNKKLKDKIDKTGESLDVKKHVVSIQKAAETWSINIINLIVIFLLQTLIIPLLLIWLLYIMIRSAFEMPKNLGTG